MAEQNLKSRIITIGLFILLFASKSLYSQFRTDPVRIIPKSPESAAFDKYINVPVSLSTGVPIISIPIYTISIDGLEIPISLSYHASGVKVDDIASPVGLNWILNAGGRVSRTIIGLDDETSVYGWTKHDPIDPTACNPRSDLEGYYLQDIDPAPDLYTYNIPGKSGSFFYNSDGTILKTTVDDVFIRDNVNIWDEKGNHFKFYDPESSGIEITRECNPMMIECADLDGVGFTAWLLKEITTPINDTVSFSYGSYEYSTPDDVVISTEYVWSNPYPYYGGSSSDDTYETTSTIDYTVRFIDQITTKKEKVEFFYKDTTAAIMQKKLYKISVTDQINNDTILKVILTHDKFQGDPRLKLTKVEFTGDDTSESKSYSFDYQSGSLPAYGSYKRDLFGYHNSNSETHMIPLGAGADPEDFGLDDFADREVDSTRILYGILNKITYPTGGSVKYYYEPNKEENDYAPGVRVKKIEYLDNDEEILKEEHFTYSGLTCQKKHEEGLFPGYYYEWSWNDVSPTALYAEKKFSSNRIQSSESIKKDYQGYYYQTIKKEVIGETSGAGYTINNYSGYLDNFALKPFLTSQVFYDKDDNRVKKVDYFYEHDTTQVTASVIDLSYAFYGNDFECGEYTSFCSATPQCGGEINLHYNQLQKLTYTSSVFSKTKEINTEYFNNDADSVCYEENSYYDIISNDSVDYILQSAISKYSITDNGDELLDSTSVKYPKDYTFGDWPESLEQSHIIGKPIDTRLYKECDEELLLTAGKTIEYNTHGQAIKEYLWEGDSPSSEDWDSDTLVTATGGFKPRISYTYDNITHNLISYTPVDNITTSFLWGYNHQYPIAKVENATVDEVSHTSFEEDENAILNEEKSKTGRKILALSGAYSITDTLVEGNYELTYFWRTDLDTEWELQIESKQVQSGGGTLTTNKSSGYIDELRVYPVDALMTTYTYDPIIGMTSSTDENSRTTYYEYDGLGRLIFVRDQDGKILKKYEYNYGNQ